MADQPDCRVDLNPAPTPSHPLQASSIQPQTQNIPMCTPDGFLCFLSILFPPIGVWVKRGICSADSLINIALCCLGYLPGLLHAWYIIFSYPDPSSYEPVSDSEGSGPGNNPQRVHYVYVASGPYQYASHPSPQGYGTVGAAPGNQFPGQQSGSANMFAQQPSTQSAKAQTPAGKTHAQPQAPVPPPQPHEENGEGSSNGPPPSYAEVIKGDHKIQTQD